MNDIQWFILLRKVQLKKKKKSWEIQSIKQKGKFKAEIKYKGKHKKSIEIQKKKKTIIRSLRFETWIDQKSIDARFKRINDFVKKKNQKKNRKMSNAISKPNSSMWYIFIIIVITVWEIVTVRSVVTVYPVIRIIICVAVTSVIVIVIIRSNIMTVVLQWLLKNSLSVTKNIEKICKPLTKIMVRAWLQIFWMFFFFQKF